jgi:hypothetical protein
VGPCLSVDRCRHLPAAHRLLARLRHQAARRLQAAAREARRLAAAQALAAARRRRHRQAAHPLAAAARPRPRHHQAQAQAPAVHRECLVAVNIVACSFLWSFELLFERYTVVNMQSHMHAHWCMKMQMCPCAQHLIHMNA